MYLIAPGNINTEEFAEQFNLGEALIEGWTFVKRKTLHKPKIDDKATAQQLKKGFIGRNNKADLWQSIKT